MSALLVAARQYFEGFAGLTVLNVSLELSTEMLRCAVGVGNFKCRFLEKCRVVGGLPITNACIECICGDQASLVSPSVLCQARKLKSQEWIKQGRVVEGRDLQRPANCKAGQNGPV